MRSSPGLQKVSCAGGCCCSAAQRSSQLSSCVRASSPGEALQASQFSPRGTRNFSTFSAPPHGINSSHVYLSLQEASSISYKRQVQRFADHVDLQITGFFPTIQQLQLSFLWWLFTKTEHDTLVQQMWDWSNFPLHTSYYAQKYHGTSRDGIQTWGSKDNLTSDYLKLTVTCSSVMEITDFFSKGNSWKQSNRSYYFL